MRWTLAILSAIASAACGAPPPSGAQGEAEALALLDRARAHHGSAVLDGAEVTFSFRGTPYAARRDGGAFRYARTVTDDAGRTVEEGADNDGAFRLVDGEPVALDAEEARALYESVNSVVYFATLPYALGDPAVRARALAPDTVGGEPFDRVEVTFAEDGGGADAGDRYVYWLRPSDGRIGALAYTYAPDPADTSRAETGTRFRVPTAERRVGGVLFQDWANLSADALRGPGAPIETFGRLHDAGRTFEVSRVALDSVRVRAL